jgi:methionine synthase II (cobalamin-independent)
VRLRLRILSEARKLTKPFSRHIQIDDPALTFFCDENFVQKQKEERTDAESLLDLGIRVHNDFLRSLPSDLRIGVHLCRGNMPGSCAVDPHCLPFVLIHDTRRNIRGYRRL